MSKFATDFSGFAVGSQPAGWSKRWNALDATPKGVFTAQAGPAGNSIGGQVLRCDRQSTGGRSVLSADALDGAADIDAKIRARTTQNNSDYSVGIGARIFEDGSGFDGYFVAMNEVSNLMIIAKAVNGTVSQIGSTFNVTGGGLVLNAWYWIRFQVIGTALKAKIWADGASEPGTWGIEVTDSSISAANYNGIYLGNTDGEVDWFSADTAGASPPDPGAGTLDLQFTAT